MQLNEYQEWTKTTAIYPGADTGDGRELLYLSLGLVSEAGEFAGKVKKLLRDGTFNQKDARAELGDVFWYLARLCDSLNVKAESVLQDNHDKLESRKDRGVIGGSGDNR